MKSTPINQLPTKTIETDNSVEEPTNHHNKSISQLKPPIDTSVNMNIDDDISINDVMSELNDNRTIELNETTRLQQQINMLQNEIENQKRQTKSMMHQNVYVPQSPSARLVNQESLNLIESMNNQLASSEGSQKFPTTSSSTKPTTTTNDNQDGLVSKILGSIGLKGVIRSLDFKLFVVVCLTTFLVFSNPVDDFVGKYIKDSKYYFVKEPMKSVMVGIIVVCLYASS